MPRPSPNEKRKIEARRKANAKLRDDNAEREKAVAVRVQRIVSDALDRSRARETLPDVAEVIARLEDARMAALACYPPQANAAVNAAMAQAKVLGYVVDKSAVAVGSPEDFVKTEEEVLQNMRERVGNRATETFVKLMKVMREASKVGDDDVIGIQYRSLGYRPLDGNGDGSANGAANE